MRFFIDSIRDAVKKDCLLPALISALTIPDAMGQCLYPDIVLKNGKRAVRQQYEKWFDDWAADGFLFPADWDDLDDSNDSDTESGANLTTWVSIFTGRMCWELRCSLLHSGDYDVSIDAVEQDENFDYEYGFELILHGCNSLSTSWPSTEDGRRAIKTVIYNIDASTLVNALCDAAETCLEETGDEVVYSSLELFDLAGWAKG